MNDETQVISALSPPISLSVGVLVWARPEGRAASLSVRAILSGSNSRISTKSRDWIFLTSLAGIGTILLAILKGASGLSPLADLSDRLEISVDRIGVVYTELVEAVVRADPAPATVTEDGMSARDASEKGKGVDVVVVPSWKSKRRYIYY